MKAAAFFDLDKTLCARPTESVFGWHLFRSRELSSMVLLDVLYTYLRYDLGLLRDFDAVKKKLLGRVFGGKDVRRIEGLWEECHSRELAHSIYREMRDCVEAHRAAGREVHVVSASLSFIVRTFCNDLGIADYHCTELAVRNDVYTGEVRGTIHYGQEKGNLLRRLADSSGIDLQQSYAYGDHLADRYMLEAVGHPVAVNPDKKLARLAARRRWRVMAVQ